MALPDLPHGLAIAMASGFFGASFFMLIQLQQKLSGSDVNDLRDLWTYRMIFLRCVVGIGAASILYFFFKSGLLEGSLWPKLTQIGCETIDSGSNPTTAQQLRACSAFDSPQKIPNLNLALMVVWSFLAGYSQTLVPTLLLQTENRMNNNADNQKEQHQT